MVVRLGVDFRHGQSLLAEMIGHINEGTVFLYGSAADANQGLWAMKPEIAAVRARRGQFCHLFRLVAGVCSVKILDLFCYHNYISNVSYV